jgi:hypothetical protein
MSLIALRFSLVPVAALPLSSFYQRTPEHPALQSKLVLVSLRLKAAQATIVSITAQRDQLVLQLQASNELTRQRLAPFRQENATLRLEMEERLHKIHTVQRACQELRLKIARQRRQDPEPTVWYPVEVFPPCDPGDDFEDQLIHQNQRLQEALETLQKRQVKEENDRRTLLSTHLELRGTVRVFARMRPTCTTEAESSAIRLRNETTLAINKQEISLDHVFGPEATQDQVFSEVAPSIQTVVDGNDVCVFSYGHTGSGKTHTVRPSLSSF